jgi:hypothetical protein
MANFESNTKNSSIQLPSSVHTSVNPQKLKSFHTLLEKISPDREITGPNKV